LSLGPDQIITKVVVPETQGPSGSGFAKFTVRNTIEFAVVNIGVFLETEKNLETCKQARITVGAVSGAPQRAVEAEDWLAGKSLSQENINKVSQKVAGSLKIMPHHGYSKSYLTECLKTQSRQALSDAVKELTDQNIGGR
jgi:CO/xanthine dehydrogenase FAD-binding subunit